LQLRHGLIKTPHREAAIHHPGKANLHAVRAPLRPHLFWMSLTKQREREPGGFMLICSTVVCSRWDYIENTQSPHVSHNSWGSWLGDVKTSMNKKNLLYTAVVWILISHPQTRINFILIWEEEEEKVIPHYVYIYILN
jgi:hypothetical protein